MVVKNVEEAEQLYKGHGMPLYGILRRHRPAFIAFAHEVSEGRLTKGNLHELGNLLKKLLAGKPEAQKDVFRERFARRLGEAHAMIRTHGAANAFQYLLEQTRAVGAENLGGTGDAEAEFFAGGAAHNRALEKAAAAEAGGGRTEHTVMFRLADLQRREDLGEDDSGVPAMELEELEEQLRAGAFKRLGRFLAKPAVVFGKKLKDAAPHSTAVQKIRPYIRRLMQLLSRDKHTVFHKDNAGVSPQHTALEFLPKRNLVAVTDLHDQREAKPIVTTLLPGRSFASPITIKIGDGNRTKTGMFKTRDSRVRLKGVTALISLGHAFDIRGNTFLIHKLTPKQVVLKGIAGPVQGRVFKFDPLKQPSISIGSALDNHIRLLTEKPKKVERRKA